MNLKKKTIQDLQKIIERDYGQNLSEEETNELGISLLRLTRLGLAARARAIENAEKQKS
jgi:hypothetical protein